MIIVDTSVAAKWIVQEPGREQALALLDGSLDIEAPDLLMPELASVLRKKEKLGEVDREQARLGVAAAASAVNKFIPSVELIDDAIRLSNQLDHSPYDCFFLAASLGRGVLITADVVFQRKCEACGFGEAVLTLSDRVSERLVQRRVLETFRPQQWRDVVRLAAKIAQTFETLREAAPKIKFRLISSRAFDLAFDSPAYIQVKRIIARMKPEQLPPLLAVAWLGRSYYNIRDLPNLLQRAEALLAEGWETHESYVISSMGSVAAGLQKLYESIQTEADLQE